MLFSDSHIEYLITGTLNLTAGANTILFISCSTFLEDLQKLINICIIHLTQKSIINSLMYYSCSVPENISSCVALHGSLGEQRGGRASTGLLEQLWNGERSLHWALLPEQQHGEGAGEGEVAFWKGLLHQCMCSTSSARGHPCQSVISGNEHKCRWGCYHTKEEVAAGLHGLCRRQALGSNVLLQEGKAALKQALFSEQLLQDKLRLSNLCRGSVRQ